MSKYDNIETALDLIREVISNGLSMNQDDINRAADIFGRTSVGELSKLATSVEKISGKHVEDCFYIIAFKIWHWRDAANFYVEHSLLLAKKHNGMQNEIRQTKAVLAKTIESETEWKNQAEHYRAKGIEHYNRAEKAETLVVELKAKLYDCLTTNAS